VHKVTIVPRGRSMGATQQLPDKDQHLFARDYMLDRLAVMMGGRAAEELVLQTATSGAEDDLKQATHVARKMVLDWGMSERLGYVALGGERQNVFLGEELGRQREYSEQTAREVDEEVRRTLQQAFDRATQVLKDNLGGLHRVARDLLDREELSGTEVSELLEANGASRPRSSLEEVVQAKIES
jgi:cell division protease FtsH